MRETTVRLDTDTHILLEMLVGIESKIGITNKSVIARRLIINEAERMEITLPDEEGQALRRVIRRARNNTKKRSARESRIQKAKKPHKILDITMLRRL